jgi:PilZ domain
MVLIAPAGDLSLEGVFVRTTAPFPQAEKVKIRISHRGAEVTAVGTVAFSQPDRGMGISFASVESASYAILEKWIAELAGQESIKLSPHQS